MFKNRNKKAFTLAEVMVALVVMSIVLAVTIKINKSRTDYFNKFMTYAALSDLKSGAGVLLSDGCTSSDTTACPTKGNKTLPLKGQASDSLGLCYRLVDAFNTIGTTDCTQTASDGTNFSTAVPNFKLSNGIAFYNFGSNATSGLYTVYVDLDGQRTGSKNTLGQDVLKFTIRTTDAGTTPNNFAGEVLPYYNSGSATGSVAATQTSYLSASVRYRSGGNYVMVDNGVSYYTATCDATGAYNGTACATQTHTDNCVSNVCEVVINKPGY